MDKAIAISNNDTVFLSWTYDSEIPGCLGFAVYRVDSLNDSRVPLPAWVGFKGGSNTDWQPKDTSVWPVQKFNWRDLTGTRGKTYTYEIQPLGGKKDALTKVGRPLTTNQVTLSPKRGSVSAYFNRGILSTQAMSRSVESDANGLPDAKVLRNRIDQPGDPLRLRLAGQILEGVTHLLQRTMSDGGECFLALYELDDPDLIQQLLAAKDRIHLILSNTGSDDKENTPARQTLHEAGVDILDRMVANGHIGHNKFCLYVDKDGRPAAVLTGSTNWSDTGLCTQSNNALIIENGEIATTYQEYWNRLKADGSAQGQALRTANRTTPARATIDGAQATVWYSPNTQQISKPAGNPPAPVDMSEVFAAMAGAKKAILFLAFQPGSPSIIEYAAAVQNVKPDLIVYGAATDPHASNDFNTILVHRSTKDVAVVPDPVVVASALNTQFDYWQKELLKLPGAHAIIHDKIVVIDPMDEDCVVITGSHNLGYRASFNNDENLVIVRGHEALAAAYATHVMDVYDHYRWRYLTQHQTKKSAFNGLDATPVWQAKYFGPNSTARRESRFWTGQTPPCADAPPPPVPKSGGPASAPLRTNGQSRAGRSAPTRRPGRKVSVGPTPAHAKKPVRRKGSAKR